MRIDETEYRTLQALQDELRLLGAAVPHRVTTALDFVMGRIEPVEDDGSVAVNDVVTVKLTEHGHRIHAEWWEVERQDSPKIPETPQPPTYAEDGTSKWLLWQLMQVFGPHLSQGSPMPFEGDIKLPSHPDSSRSVISRFKRGLQNLREMDAPQ